MYNLYVDKIYNVYFFKCGYSPSTGRHPTTSGVRTPPLQRRGAGVRGWRARGESPEWVQGVRLRQGAGEPDTGTWQGRFSSYRFIKPGW